MIAWAVQHENDTLIKDTLLKTYDFLLQTPSSSSGTRTIESELRPKELNTSLVTPCPFTIPEKSNWACSKGFCQYSLLPSQIFATWISGFEDGEVWIQSKVSYGLWAKCTGECTQLWPLNRWRFFTNNFGVVGRGFAFLTLWGEKLVSNDSGEGRFLITRSAYGGIFRNSRPL